MNLRINACCFLQGCSFTYLLFFFFFRLFFPLFLLWIWSAAYLDNVYHCVALYGCLWTIIFQAEECRYYDPYLAEEKNEAVKCEWLAITRKSMSRTGTRKSFLSPNVVLLNLHAFRETTQTCPPLCTDAQVYLKDEIGNNWGESWLEEWVSQSWVEVVWRTGWPKPTLCCLLNTEPCLKPKRCTGTKETRSLLLWIHLIWGENVLHWGGKKWIKSNVDRLTWAFNVAFYW